MVIILYFCQNDSLIGGSLWQKDRMVTHILFDLCLFKHVSPVANFDDQSLIYRLIIFHSMGEERKETTILNITHITKKIITTTLMREIINSMKTLVLILLKTVLLIFLHQDMDMLSESPIQEQVN